ncbi:hypothetical protein V6N13_111631 [Hibiscus sabdariffa]|uniref:Uncharacterized protein n=1 Tax=Hibiscus sabdariffa TaxID=183260 RepID=A0ABR2TL18_9ROSI
MPCRCKAHFLKRFVSQASFRQGRVSGAQVQDRQTRWLGQKTQLLMFPCFSASQLRWRLRKSSEKERSNNMQLLIKYYQHQQNGLIYGAAVKGRELEDPLLQRVVGRQ